MSKPILLEIVYQRIARLVRKIQVDKYEIRALLGDRHTRIGCGQRSTNGVALIGQGFGDERDGRLVVVDHQDVTCGLHCASLLSGWQSWCRSLLVSTHPVL